jgi:hypothetical protein
MNETKVHLCFECGQKNRVPHGSEQIALCGGCGRRLYPNLSTNPRSVASTSTNSNPPTAGNNDGSKLGWTITIVVAFLIPVFIVGYGLNEGRQAQPKSQPVANAPTPRAQQSQAARPSAPVFSREPELLVPGILWNKSGRRGEAPFEIRSRAGTNYILKLVDAHTGNDAVAILVRGGSTVEVDIPIGTYNLKWCSGTIWYGEEGLFGPGQSCSTTPTAFRFWKTGTYIEGHTITLYTVTDGNMSYRRLNPSEF